jgi:AcrR family transcriptional regulator
MSRTVKEHDVRKKEIVDTAERLFLEYGYEETPVEMIIKDVGIAKGTFYYYFRSKDELLDELVENLIEEVTGSIKRISEDEEGDPLLKIFKVSRYFRNLGVSKQKLTDYLHEDRNIHLHHRVEKKVLPVMAACYSKLIEQGNEEGIFKVNYPYETAVGILGAANYLSDIDHEDFGHHVVEEEGMAAIIDLMERMLGMKEGKLMEFTKKMERGE